MNNQFLDNLEEADSLERVEILARGLTALPITEVDYVTTPAKKVVADAELLKLASSLLDSILRGSLRSIQYECTDLIVRAGVLLAEEKKAFA